MNIFDVMSERRAFAAGTKVAAGCPALIFGGLSLNNGGDTVSVKDATAPFDSVTYGSEGGLDDALTRSPDLTGSFVRHTSVSAELFSPGKKLDGAAFC